MVLYYKGGDIMDLKKLYNENKDFNEYVDKYSAHHEIGKPISVEEALTHLIVKNVAEEYVNGSKQSKKDTSGVSSENGMVAMS